VLIVTTQVLTAPEHPAVSLPAGSSNGTGLQEPARRRAFGPHAVAIVSYLAVSLLLWSHVWLSGNPAHSITCNCGDPSQQIWWFEWLPWAVAHGHNPLLTNAMWARLGGVNALSNTSWLLPAAVLSPVTVLFGPVASFNLANLLAPVLSGWAAFALAGRITRMTGARLLAGGLYAFSPYMLRNTVIGHIGLTMTAYLPLVLLLGLRLLERNARPARIGIWLGALTILQFFTGLEVLALTFTTAFLGGLALMAWRPDAVVRARQQLTRAAVVGASLSAVVLAYPVWFFLAGPRHVVGPFWPVQSENPWQILSAGPDVFSTHTGLDTVGYLGRQGPNTDYLGFGILLAVALSIPVWRRHVACRVVAVTAVACWVLEAVPSQQWAKLPLLSGIEPIRFALPVSLCVALLLGASIDGWWAAARRKWPGERQETHRRLARTATVVLAGAALIPLLDTYSLPFTVTSATVPAWFDHQGSHLAPGTAVLTIPFAYGTESRPMAWQAESGDTFALIGGWAFIPGANGVDDQIVSPLRGPVAALRILGRHPSKLTTAQQDSIRSALERWRPLVVVLVPHGAPAGAVRALTDTLGLRPSWSDGAWVWNLRAGSRLGPMTPVRT